MPPSACYFSGFWVSAVLSSALDEHPVSTPQVGSPALRMMNWRTSQTPMTAKIVPMPSMWSP
jgi:hypothetical protein